MRKPKLIISKCLNSENVDITDNLMMIKLYLY